MSAEQTFKTAASDGTEIGCEVRGSGPALMMVHGTATDHHCFDRITPMLAERFTLYLMDRRGRGLSGDNADWSPEKEFSDVAAMVDAIAEKTGGPTFLFGHSLGGLCSLEGTALTNNVARLQVYDPIISGLVPHDREDTVQALVDAGKTGDPEDIIVTHLSGWIGLTPDQIDKQRQNADLWARRLEWAHTIPREYEAERYYKVDADHLKKIVAPLKVLVGAESFAPLQTSADWITEILPQTEKQSLPGHGHYAFNADPDMFADLVIDFFTNQA